MHIGGNNFSPAATQPAPPEAESYFFSGQVNSWGWATWQRAWHHYDFDYTLLPELRQRGALHGSFPSALARRFWLGKFEAERRAAAPRHVWDYQWHFAVAAHSGLTIVPAVNLVTNIGFGHEATHTRDPLDRLAHLATAELAFPLRHPPTVLRDWRRDRQQFRAHLAERAWGRARHLLDWLLPLAGPAPKPALAPAPVVSYIPASAAAL